MFFNLTTKTTMKKIILTLLLTLSTLVNVNPVAAFSLDVDGNESFTASNDGLIIFKYLLNSNANNLHTTISSNALGTRRTTPELRAYLDGAGDILDVDGNGSFTASNDGLIIFKYLLNSNANNLHTTVSSNAPEGRQKTAELKAYLDRLGLESNFIDVSVGSSTIQAFDSYATGCGGSECNHNFVAAIGIEQGGKLSAADGSILYDNFVEHFASGPLLKDSIPQNTSTNRIWLPPNSSSCNAVFFNDKMRIYNPTANDISVMRLINSSGTITSEVVNQARNNCSMVGPADQDLRYTNPISNILVDPVTVTANAFTMFNINGQKLDLSALEIAKILFVDKADYNAKIAAGEPLTFDSCMQMEFSIQGDTDKRSTDSLNKDLWIPCIQSSYEYLNTQPGTPIANAGSDQSVAFSTTVNLSGSATDSDGTIVSYAWTQIYGTKLTLTAADTANASFDSSGVDYAGEVLTFALTVTDNDGVTARDNVIITVAANPDRLIANAGIDQSNIEIGATVTLTASASVGTGTISSYVWQQISGVAVSITSANSTTTSFVAPRATASGTTIDIVLQLTVTDSNNATATDTITITVDAFIPVTSINIGTANNDGTQNFDYNAGVRNGTPITYALGTNVTITPANATKQTIVWSGNDSSALGYSIGTSTGLITSNRSNEDSASDGIRATIVGAKFDGTDFFRIKTLHIQDEHYGSTCNNCHNPDDGISSTGRAANEQYYDQ